MFQKPIMFLTQEHQNRRITQDTPLKRVTCARQSRYYQLSKDFSLTKEEFKVIDSSKKPLLLEARKVATKHLSKANQIIGELDNHFTFEEFKRGFHSNTKSVKDFYSIYEEYVKNLREDGRNKTANCYEDTLKSLKKHRKTLQFRDITQEFLREYAKTFVSGKIPGAYARYIRAVYNYGIDGKKVASRDHYPFGRGKYSIPRERTKQESLTEAELRTLYAYQQQHLHDKSTQKLLAVDMFLFSYLCFGMNFTDVARLKAHNIVKEDKPYISNVRGKTAEKIVNARPVRIFLNKVLQSILQRHGDPYAEGNEYIFPFIADDMNERTIEQRIEEKRRAFRKQLKKEVAKELGIQPFTFDYARHTFSTIMSNKGYEDSQIGALMGHVPNITQGYMDVKQLKLFEKASRDILKTLTK